MQRCQCPIFWWYPWPRNLNLTQNVKDIVVFLTRKVINSDYFSITLTVHLNIMHIFWLGETVINVDRRRSRLWLEIIISKITWLISRRKMLNPSFNPTLGRSTLFNVVLCGIVENFLKNHLRLFYGAYLFSKSANSIFKIVNFWGMISRIGF